jgi:hypothetical protein
MRLITVCYLHLYSLYKSYKIYHCSLSSPFSYILYRSYEIGHCLLSSPLHSIQELWDWSLFVIFTFTCLPLHSIYHFEDLYFAGVSCTVDTILEFKPFLQHDFRSNLHIVHKNLDRWYRTAVQNSASKIELCHRSNAVYRPTVYGLPYHGLRSMVPRFIRPDRSVGI